MKFTINCSEGIFKAISFRRVLTFTVCLICSCQLWAQNTLPLAHISFLKSSGSSSKAAGDVRSSLTFIKVSAKSLEKAVKSTSTSTAGSDKADEGNQRFIVKPAASKQTKEPAYEEVKNLLQKNTCLACHNPNTRQVGPAYKDVTKRKYTVAQIVELIYKPKPEHWPDYSTPMPPMTQVPNEEARKIAEWIKSLEKLK